MGLIVFRPSYGLYTDMNAIRSDEELDNLHSLYVDQWDWEQTITPEDRNLEFLKATVRKIYEAMKSMEQTVYEAYSHIYPILPKEITFIHTEDLLKEYPHLSPREREIEVTKKYRAIFLIGIGGPLSDGEIHDGRAPDYDDWTTPTTEGHKGLNGDIIFWNPIINSAIEISSMGIRVDKETLLIQLKIRGCEERTKLEFHKALSKRPSLFQSVEVSDNPVYVCFFCVLHILGRSSHQYGLNEMIETCRKHNIHLK